ncbi:MAG: MICOS complex subunit MIC60 [Pirellulales bacterium]|nr:MICOS complex subunit MIC60 [Pirellulales bacterium]
MRSARLASNGETQEAGQDSFLDVVANVVGVLIILVMVVGLQASHSMLVKQALPADETVTQTAAKSKHDLDKLREEINKASSQAFAARREVQEAAQRVVAIRREAAAHDERRVELAMHRAVMEEDIARRRKRLDSQQQREFDVQRQLFESQLKLEQMTQEQLTLVSTPDTVEVECVPTPLAKTVDGPATHLRLRHGLVSIVPFQQLQDEVEFQIESMRRRLRSRDGIQDTFGPIDGYRLKFVVQRVPQASAVRGPIVGQIERTNFEYIGEFLPNSERFGQNVEQALMPGAALYTHLQEQRRERFPIVVWLYTDSFNEFRILKGALWEMGFLVAIRPLQPGAQIRASSRGTKASAQ